MNLSRAYIILFSSGRWVVAPDAPEVARQVGVSKHTIHHWFRKQKIVDKWIEKGFIILKGEGEYIKSNRGKNNLKIKKYNW